MSNLKFKHEVRGYEKALSVMVEHNAKPGRGRKDTFKLAHNTEMIVHRDYSGHEPAAGHDYPVKYIAVEYHENEIVKYWPSGAVEVTCAGWRTQTTLNRLHKLTPNDIFIGQKNFEMVINGKPVSEYDWHNIADYQD